MFITAVLAGICFYYGTRGPEPMQPTQQEISRVEASQTQTLQEMLKGSVPATPGEEQAAREELQTRGETPQ